MNFKLSTSWTLSQSIATLPIRAIIPRDMTIKPSLERPVFLQSFKPTTKGKTLFKNVHENLWNWDEQLYKTGVGKQRAEVWYRSVKKLLPGRAGPRPNWSKSDWNNWHKEHTADAIGYIIIPTGRNILLRQTKPRSPSELVPCWLASCNKFACAKRSLFYWGPVRKIMPGWNRSAARKRLPTPAIKDCSLRKSVFVLCIR